MNFRHYEITTTTFIDLRQKCESGVNNSPDNSMVFLHIYGTKCEIKIGYKIYMLFHIFESVFREFLK